MDMLWALAFALAVGLTVAGFAGSIMEIAAGTRLRLAPPFVDRQRIILSLAASFAAGPFMLVNDALDARAARRIGGPAFALCVVIALGWTLASGIVATELAILVAGG